MNKNENLIQTQRDRIAAMGRKPIALLEAGDEFTHSFYGDLEFLGWVKPEVPGIGAYVREIHGDPNKTRCVPLNVAGSVKML